MSSHEEEPGDYTLLLVPKTDADIMSLMKDIQRNKIIPLYIELTIPRVTDYASGKKSFLAEITIKEGE